jgi:hypothetical protein
MCLQIQDFNAITTFQFPIITQAESGSLRKDELPLQIALT